MKKTIALFFSATAILILAGCVSVETVPPGNLNSQKISATETPLAHLNVQNWGLYLFSIPLFTGSTTSVGSIDVFKDTVNLESVFPVVIDQSKALGAKKTLDIASQYSESGFIFYSRSINVSANSVK